MACNLGTLMNSAPTAEVHASPVGTRGRGHYEADGGGEGEVVELRDENVADDEHMVVDDGSNISDVAPDGSHGRGQERQKGRPVSAASHESSGVDSPEAAGPTNQSHSVLTWRRKQTSDTKVQCGKSRKVPIKVTTKHSELHEECTQSHETPMEDSSGVFLPDDGRNTTPRNNVCLLSSPMEEECDSIRTPDDCVQKEKKRPTKNPSRNGRGGKKSRTTAAAASRSSSSSERVDPLGRAQREQLQEQHPFYSSFQTDLPVANPRRPPFRRGKLQQSNQYRSRSAGNTSALVPAHRSSLSGRETDGQAPKGRAGGGRPGKVTSAPMKPNETIELDLSEDESGGHKRGTYPLPQETSHLNDRGEKQTTKGGSYGMTRPLAPDKKVVASSDPFPSTLKSSDHGSCQAGVYAERYPGMTPVTGHQPSPSSEQTKCSLASHTDEDGSVVAVSATAVASDQSQKIRHDGGALSDLKQKEIGDAQSGKGGVQKFSKVNGREKQQQKRIPKKVSRGRPIAEPGSSLLDSATTPTNVSRPRTQTELSWGSGGSSERTAPIGDQTPVSTGADGKSRGIDAKRFYESSRTEDGKAKRKPSTSGGNSRIPKDRSPGVLGRMSETVSNIFGRVTTRSKAKKKQEQHDVITIDSSSDEDENDAEDKAQLKQALEESLNEKDSPGRDGFGNNRHTVHVVRIAVGKKVFSKGCRLQVQPGTKQPCVTLSFSKKEAGNREDIRISAESIEELKYFVADEGEAGRDADGKPGSAKEDSCTEGADSVPDERSGNAPLPSSSEDLFSFIAMRVKPSDENMLKQYTKSYLQNDEEDDEANDSGKRFVVVELRSDSDLKIFGSNTQEGLFSVLLDGAKLDASEIARYIPVLKEECEKEKKLRLSSSPSKRTRRSGDNSGSAEDGSRLLFVYPFVGGEQVETATDGLKEAKGIGERKTAEEILEKQKKLTAGRTHYITIKKEDRDRLAPTEFLNDSLVDFWMRWLSRDEDPLTSNVHFFTSHFYTTLSEKNGVEAVKSWTAKKRINVFEKRFIFVPVNQSLHWSLCVIVNPGSILNGILEADNNVCADRPDDEDPMPCFLFMDSLKAHQKSRVANKLRLWLGSEWKRLGKPEKMNGVKIKFTRDAMPVDSPNVPFQDNSWDCGVFVCRYAYAMYQLRHRDMTFMDLGYEGGPIPYETAIVQNTWFQFGMEDIKRLREEMRTLVDRLADVYARTMPPPKGIGKANGESIESPGGKARKEETPEGGCLAADDGQEKMVTGTSDETEHGDPSDHVVTSDKIST